MDAIKVEILEDGTISVETDAISGVNHLSADQLLSHLAKLAGGAVTRAKRIDVKAGIKVPLHQHADGSWHGDR